VAATYVACCGCATSTLVHHRRLQMITLGGDAELELVDSLDPFTEVRGSRGVRKRGLHRYDVSPSSLMGCAQGSVPCVCHHCVERCTHMSVAFPQNRASSSACARPRRAGRTSAT